MASTYGIAPPLTVGHDGELELPCSEALWQARTEAEWNEARVAEGAGSGAATTVRDACALIVDDNGRESALRWSPFAVACVMHILATRLWHVSHGTLSAATTLRAVSTAAPPTTASPPDTAAAAPSLHAAGRRCHDLIRAYGEHVEQQGDSTLRGTREAGWQLADAADVLRVCYGRTVPALARLDCDTLMRGGEGDVRAAAREHVAAPLERTAEFALAAAVAFVGLCVPARHGSQLYRKAGALSGSLENLVAGWDNGESPGGEAHRAWLLR